MESNQINAFVVIGVHGASSSSGPDDDETPPATRSNRDTTPGNHWVVIGPEQNKREEESVKGF